MDTVVVRYGEIGSKSRRVRGQMEQVLRQRVEDRLEYEGIAYSKVSHYPSRVIVKTDKAGEAARELAELPGVSSTSPAISAGTSMDELKQAAEQLGIGDSFGVDTNRSGEHEFDSRDVNREVGSYIMENFDTEVDLDDPETWVRVDLRDSVSFVYSEEFKGSDGFPVGSQGEVVALISGGIDSPVAAYEIMTRGADITPIYFYNKPIAAEDHLLRFESALQKLERFHPGKKWSYFVVDMQDINEELMEKFGSGRMIVHRRLMFRIAERIAEKEGLNGIVTGESMGQKSSQTPRNLEATTEAVSKPILRPLLTWSKSEISEKARELGTMKDASIESACTSLSPENPSTRIAEGDLAAMEQELDIESMVNEAAESADERLL